MTCDTGLRLNILKKMSAQRKYLESTGEMPGKEGTRKVLVKLCESSINYIEVFFFLSCKYWEYNRKVLGKYQESNRKGPGK